MGIDFLFDAEGTFDLLTLLTIQKLVNRIGSLTPTLIQNRRWLGAEQGKLQLPTALKHFCGNK